MVAVTGANEVMLYHPSVYFPNTFGLNFKMTSPPPPHPPPKRLKSCCCHKKKNKYEIKANKKIEHFELNKWFAPPCAFYIPRYPLCQGIGGLVTP